MSDIVEIFDFVASCTTYNLPLNPFIKLPVFKGTVGNVKVL